MELVWLIVQATVLCTALLAVTCGLIWAPWYLLLLVLGVVLVSIQHFMPDLKRAIPEVDDAIAPSHSAIAHTSSPQAHSPASFREPVLTASRSTHLIYRGVDYVLSQEHEGRPV